MDANLVRRVGFATAAIPVALLLVWYGGLPLALFLAAAGALATRELFDLAQRVQIRPARVIGLASAAAIAPITYATLAAPGVRATVVDAWPYAAALWLPASQSPQDPWKKGLFLTNQVQNRGYRDSQ